MKKTVFIFLTIIMSLVITACGKESEMTGNTYEQISQEDAKNLIDSESDYIILDVRTQEEYDQVHIKGAICIPNETIDETVTEKLPNLDQLILVYCRSGNRSVKAAEKLAGLGYTNIKEFGGINTWEYETEQ